MKADSEEAGKNKRHGERGRDLLRRKRYGGKCESEREEN